MRLKRCVTGSFRTSTRVAKRCTFSRLDRTTTVELFSKYRDMPRDASNTYRPRAAIDNTTPLTGFTTLPLRGYQFRLPHAIPTEYHYSRRRSTLTSRTLQQSNMIHNRHPFNSGGAASPRRLPVNTTAVCLVGKKCLNSSLEVPQAHRLTTVHRANHPSPPNKWLSSWVRNSISPPAVDPMGNIYKPMLRYQGAQ